MQPAREVSGGCAGNTAAGISALGGRAGFVGQVAPDQLGEFYRHDLTAAGVEFTTPPVDVGVPTARSMILVTPDGHRTMNTFLGAAQELSVEVLDEEQIRSSGNPLSRGLFVGPGDPSLCDGEGDRGRARSGTKGRVQPVRPVLRRAAPRRASPQLIDDGRIDILFANEAEILAMGGVPHLETALATIAPRVETLVVTRGAAGALAVRRERTSRRARRAGQ